MPLSHNANGARLGRGVAAGNRQTQCASHGQRIFGRRQAAMTLQRRDRLARETSIFEARTKFKRNYNDNRFHRPASLFAARQRLKWRQKIIVISIIHTHHWRKNHRPQRGEIARNCLCCVVVVWHRRTSLAEVKCLRRAPLCTPRSADKQRALRLCSQSPSLGFIGAPPSAHLSFVGCPPLHMCNGGCGCRHCAVARHKDSGDTNGPSGELAAARIAYSSREMVTHVRRAWWRRTAQCYVVAVCHLVLPSHWRRHLFGSERKQRA
jgi:hypothetical protein